MLTAAANTLLQLALVAVPVLVGYLAGRHIRQRHLDQIEHDAWHDGWDKGYAEGYLTCLDDHNPHDLDEISGQLDAAVQQTHPSDQPWWN